MGMIQAGIDLLSNAFFLFGGGMFIVGLIVLFSGYSDNDPASKKQGIGLVIGGIGIAAVAKTLIPMLNTLI